jgi:anti-sigma regulatory factor (Ser/Thr protein kinase)
MRNLLVIGPFPWSSVRLAATDWANCHVIEAAGEADAIRLMRIHAFDVIVTNPSTTATRDMAIVQEAHDLQPGIRAIVLADELTPVDIIAALRAQVFACFTTPINREELKQSIDTALEEGDWHNGIQVLSAVPDWIALRVASRRATAERLVRFMTELAGDLRESDRFKAITAFREVLLNAMEHGAGFDPEKVVEVHAIRTKRAAVYYFKDPGTGFNPAAPELVATTEDPIGHMAERDKLGMRPGGFGLLLAKGLVNEMRYSERGNEVILVKHLD